MQREKTLDKFKKRQSNILVATDVAARGIDVVNLTHVINYSLPQSANAYVHRIGRTGRAGNEGTAITFITPSEYKRLMSIQRMTKTDIKKSKLPTVKEIIKAKRRKVYDDLDAIIKGEMDEKFINWAKRLLSEREPIEVLSALLTYTFAEELNPSVYGDIADMSQPSKPLEKHGKARLFVALGKKDRMNPRKLVKLITSRCSVNSRDINDIQVLDIFSFVTVPFIMAEEIVASFKEKGRKPLVTHVKKDKKRKKKKR